MDSQRILAGIDGFNVKLKFTYIHVFFFFLDRPRRAGIRRLTGREEKQSSANTLISQTSLKLVLNEPFLDFLRNKIFVNLRNFELTLAPFPVKARIPILPKSH